MSLLFHGVPDPMAGSALHPLNELEERAPEAWRKERAKYEGREHVLEITVPIFDCLWNDVLHLSPVHPAKIVAALAEAGLQPLRRRFFAIDPHELDADRALVFLNRRDDVGDPLDDSQWLRFDPALVEGLSHLTEPTRRYYAECAARGTRPLLWGYLPHVLFHGSLDTRALRVIDV